MQRLPKTYTLQRWKIAAESGTANKDVATKSEGAQVELEFKPQTAKTFSSWKWSSTRRKEELNKTLLKEFKEAIQEYYKGHCNSVKEEDAECQRVIDASVSSLITEEEEQKILSDGLSRQFVSSKLIDIEHETGSPIIVTKEMLKAEKSESGKQAHASRFRFAFWKRIDTHRLSGNGESDRASCINALRLGWKGVKAKLLAQYRKLRGKTHHAKRRSEVENLIPEPPPGAVYNGL